MSPNMSTLDRTARTVVAIAIAATGVAIGPGSAAAIVMFAIAAVLLTTSAIGFCPLYALVRFDSRGRRPLPH